jgi:hypothetical protein
VWVGDGTEREKGEGGHGRGRPRVASEGSPAHLSASRLSAPPGIQAAGLTEKSKRGHPLSLGSLARQRSAPHGPRGLGVAGLLVMGVWAALQVALGLWDLAAAPILRVIALGLTLSLPAVGGQLRQC